MTVCQSSLIAVDSSLLVFMIFYTQLGIIRCVCIDALCQLLTVQLKAKKLLQFFLFQSASIAEGLTIYVFSFDCFVSWLDFSALLATENPRLLLLSQYYPRNFQDNLKLNSVLPFRITLKIFPLLCCNVLSYSPKIFDFLGANCLAITYKNKRNFLYFHAPVSLFSIIRVNARNQLIYMKRSRHTEVQKQHKTDRFSDVVCFYNKKWLISTTSSNPCDFVFLSRSSKFVVMVLPFFRHPAHFLYIKTNSEAKIGKAIKTN